MGRLIDTSELAKHIALQKKRFGNLLEVPICNVFADMIRDTPTVEAIPKADYENRLKADMVAMLTEIQLEFEEIENPFGTRISGCSQDGWKHGVKNCDFVIQQKINELKADQEGKNDKR